MISSAFFDRLINNLGLDKSSIEFNQLKLVTQRC